MSDREDRVLLRRREFLQGGVATLGAAALPFGSSAETQSPEVGRFARLGRTEMQISDISFGSSRTTSPEVVAHALDRGINYFDTAESYRGGRSEEAIGQALRGKRDGVFIASKVKCGTSTTQSELMETLEGSLRRLQTDRVDVYFNHAVNDPDRLKNPEWEEFAARAKQQGKIRFTGMSGHAGRLVECLDYALDRDLFDVILVAYNFGSDPAFYERFTRAFDFVAVQPDLPRVLDKARAKDVGVVAMKTLMGGRLNDLRPYERTGSTFSQAAFRWVLSGGKADALIVSMKSRAEIDEYLVASGDPSVQRGDLDLLDRYAGLNSAGYCRPGCAACGDACPHGVDIAEVLRTRMYAVDYGDIELARRDYAALGPGASACSSCAAQSCLGTCPWGLEIPTLTRSARELLARDSGVARYPA